MTETFSGPAGTPRSSLDRFIEAVASSGLKYKTTRDHVQVECPTHTDSAPSLSADWDPGAGRVLFKCQAGCDGEDVLAALALTWPMLYDDYEDPDTFAARRAREREEERKTGQKAKRAPKRPRVERTRPARPAGRLPKKLTFLDPTPLSDWAVTTTYDYCDTAGTLVHQEVRHQREIEVLDPITGESRTKVEKRFTQRWPDDKNGWLEKTPAGFVPVLYRLPDVAEWIAEGRRIWLAEGAKDAERFIELGEAATTNPSGADNFKREQAASLAGAHVVAVMDHDLAGYRRGRKLNDLLTKGETPVASLQFALPATTGRHQDASDHLDAGYSLDDFLMVSIEELAELEQVAEAEEAALLAAEAAPEAAARAQRALDATSPKIREDESRYAVRWAAEAAKQLVKAVAALEVALQVGPVDAELQLRFSAAIATAQDAARDAHRAAGIEVPDDLIDYLQPPAFPAVEPKGTAHSVTADLAAAAGEDLDDEDDSPSGNVVDHPTASRFPDPTDRFPMSRGAWAYELGGAGRRRRGVYQWDDGRWTKVAPLPYLHARIVSRDGYGRPTGTYYLISAEPNSDKVTIGHDELVKHTWPNILGLAVSHDDKILKAATTALVFAAETETDLVEATPRVTEDGKIALPVPETLPHGYLATTDLDRAEALAVWAEVVQLVSESPRMAMVLGASAFGPFLAAMGNRQPHIVSLHGDMAQGKSVTMRMAASIWGNPGSKAEAGVCESWNQSKLAPTAYLGELGVLPAFFDEIGMAGNLTAADWGKRIFDICEGASRGRPASNGRPGFVRGRSWYGILLSAGNSRLMDGIGAGGMAGTQRRVVEIGTPFTHSREHSDAIEALFPKAFGHLGMEILERHSAATVERFLADAEELLGKTDYESPVAQEVVKHLLSHIAGAAIIDDIVGTNGLLAAAATDGALEYLAEWEEPLHDADRMLDAIHDSLFQEPSCWPTVAQHLENTAPAAFDGGGTQIARHGVAIKTKGLVSNNQDWIAVFPNVWEELCKDLGVDSDVACRELTNRQVLIRQSSSHKPGARNHTSVIKVGKSAKRFYKLTFPVLDEPDDIDGDDLEQPPAKPIGPGTGDDHGGQGDVVDGGTSPNVDEQPAVQPSLDIAISPGQAPVAAEVTAEQPEVTAEVTAPKPPLTCAVTAVTAVTAPFSHVGAHGREEVSPGPVDLTDDTSIERLPADADRPGCVVCTEPVGQLVDGIPLHLGQCFDEHQEQTRPDPQPRAEQHDHEHHDDQQDHEQGDEQEQRDDRCGGPAPRREARFTAPAACLDGEGVHLADGSVQPWPEVRHFGDLALLTGRDRLRLGWGGGEDRLPDQGQIWLYPAALERLGLPIEAPALPDKALSKKQRARENAKAYAQLDEHPMVAGALEEGWQLGQGGHLDVWTRIWHTELLPQGAMIVGLPWHRIEGVALFEDGPAPGELARRLLLFARHAGVAYRITTAATGLDLIDHHRPPRRSIDDDLGAGRGRVALIRNTAAELPPWRIKTRDARFNGLEQDFSWWRTWDKLPVSESGRRYVHGYDRNASYLVPWRSIELGVENLIHRTGDDARWDGKEKPGYYLVDGGWEWPHWGLPDPGTAAGARVSNGRVWVTVHTLRQLKAHGVEPTVHESYTWGTTARYLEGPGIALAQARLDLTAAAAQDPGAAAALATIKALYSSTVGKLAESEHNPEFHLWRPDWRDHVIAATRTAILHTVSKAQEISGEHPLVVDRDAVFYASDDPDPIGAWPGDPAKLGPALGSWKPIGTADLATWGPKHLVKRPGRWHYADAVDELRVAGATNAGAVTGDA